jgi:hypothetical protein
MRRGPKKIQNKKVWGGDETGDNEKGLLRDMHKRPFVVSSQKGLLWKTNLCCL